MFIYRIKIKIDNILTYTVAWSRTKGDVSVRVSVPDGFGQEVVRVKVLGVRKLCWISVKDIGQH